LTLSNIHIPSEDDDVDGNPEHEWIDTFARITTGIELESLRFIPDKKRYRVYGHVQFPQCNTRSAPVKNLRGQIIIYDDRSNRTFHRYTFATFE
jgi:hypothetical protein